MDVREKLIELFYDNNMICDQKIEGLADDVMDIIGNGVTVQEWISVTERLPEEDKDYLVITNAFGRCSSVKIRSFAKDGETIDEYDLAGKKYVWYFWSNEYGYVSTNSVTHWMPIPHPPKGE